MIDTHNIEEMKLDSSIAFDDLPGAIFNTLRVQHGLYFGTHNTGKTDIDGFDISEFGDNFGLEVIFLTKGKDKSFQNNAVFFKADGDNKYIIHAHTYKTYGVPGEGSLNIQVAGTDIDGCAELCAQMVSSLKFTEPPKDHIKTTFWTQSAHGPVSTMKRLKCPEWNEIEDNYTDPVSDKLTKLITGGKPAETSGLILWTGEPGTGKTTALRSMIREWSEFCNAYVITDPENFLNDVNYVNEVIIEDDEATKPLLLIMEDAGELITADARNKTGQALSRLLNITDGLLGQGMNLYVLITTNEDIGKLHEAVRRPGRCISNIEFKELGNTEAVEWLEEKGANTDISGGGKTIAELYAILKGTLEEESARKPVGFAM